MISDLFSVGMMEGLCHTGYISRQFCECVCVYVCVFVCVCVCVSVCVRE